MLLYIFSHKFFKCVFFLLYQSIYMSKSITCLSYNDSKSVYIFLGRPNAPDLKLAVQERKSGVKLRQAGLSHNLNYVVAGRVKKLLKQNTVHFKRRQKWSKGSRCHDGIRYLLQQHKLLSCQLPFL